MNLTCLICHSESTITLTIEYVEIWIKLIQNTLCLSFLEGKPDAPSKPTVSDIKTNQMRVLWAPPDFDGGTPIVSYLVEFKASSSSKWNQVKRGNYANASIVVADLCEKTQYQFRVSAENQIGLGSYSTPSDLYNTLGIFYLFLVHTYTF